MGTVDDMAARWREVGDEWSHDDLRSLPNDDQAFLRALVSVVKLDFQPIMQEIVREEFKSVFGAYPQANETMAMMVAISQSLAQLDEAKIKWFVATHNKSVRNFWGKDRDMLASILDSAWTWQMVRPVLKWAGLVGIGLWGLMDGGSATIWIKTMLGLI